MSDINKRGVENWLIEALKSYDGLMSTNPDKEPKRLFKGITYDKTRDRYQARITFKTVKHEAYFNTEQEALDWYESMSLKLYGYDRIHEPHLRSNT